MPDQFLESILMSNAAALKAALRVMILVTEMPLVSLLTFLHHHSVDQFLEYCCLIRISLLNYEQAHNSSAAALSHSTQRCICMLRPAVIAVSAGHNTKSERCSSAASNYIFLKATTESTVIEIIFTIL